MPNWKSKIIVAMDDIKIWDALALVSKMHDHIWGVKINDMLLKHGVEAIRLFEEAGANVFADPKLYDIPNTVSNSVFVLADAGASIITVHAEGGQEMMKAALDVVDPEQTNYCCQIAAVTCLTSRNFGTWSGAEALRDKAVEGLALEAQMAGIRTVVCAARDLPVIPAGLRIIVPGVRPQGTEKNDQVYTTDKDVGASYYVIGRPILRAEDPVRAAQELNEALSR